MILVTGATGFVGRHIVKELRAQGYEVRALVRNSQKAKWLATKLGCELVEGDVLKPETLGPAMKGVQAVIHLVGIIAETPKVSYREAHIEATRHVLAAAKQAGVKRILHMSALGTRAHARSAYHQTKWEAEELVRSSGMDWTIFRPSVIYGEGDHLVSFLRKLVSWPWNVMNSYHLPIIGGGYSRVQPVPIEEVVRCFTLAISRPESIANTPDICGPKAIAWRDFIASIVRSTGQKPVFDDWWGLFFLRNVIWFLAISLPVITLILGVFDAAPGYVLAILGLAALGSIWAAWAWRSVLLVRVPFWPFQFLGWLADLALPPYARFSGLLAMMDEDNEGYNIAAEELFSYKAQPLEEGLQRFV